MKIEQCYALTQEQLFEALTAFIQKAECDSTLVVTKYEPSSKAGWAYVFVVDKYEQQELAKKNEVAS